MLTLPREIGILKAYCNLNVDQNIFFFSFNLESVFFAFPAYRTQPVKVNFRIKFQLVKHLKKVKILKFK